MDLVTCSECGNDVSETTATAPPKQARKTHPIMWVAFAAVIPLLVWTRGSPGGIEASYNAK